MQPRQFCTCLLRRTTCMFTKFLGAGTSFTRLNRDCFNTKSKPHKFTCYRRPTLWACCQKCCDTGDTWREKGGGGVGIEKLPDSLTWHEGIPVSEIISTD